LSKTGNKGKTRPWKKRRGQNVGPMGRTMGIGAQGSNEKKLAQGRENGKRVRCKRKLTDRGWWRGGPGGLRN